MELDRQCGCHRRDADLAQRIVSTTASIVAGGLLVLGLTAVIPDALQAQNTCNGNLQISYVSTQAFNTQGSIDRVRVSVGAGDIQGGTTLTINQVSFDLDCKGELLAQGCTDDGAVAGFVGNITTTCAGVTFTANSTGGVPGAANPNQVVFALNPPLILNANTPGQFFCNFEFDVQKLALQSNDTTPLVIEELAGFVSSPCDTNPTLFAANTVSGSLIFNPTPTPTFTNTPTRTPTRTATATRTPCLTCMPMCGNGIIEAGEQCDNGANNGDNKPCLGNRPNSVCALPNGTLVTGGGGNPNALVRCTYDRECFAFGAKCTGNPQCRLNQCGDQFVCSDVNCTTGNQVLTGPNAGLPGPEVCDDGNTSSMDACTPFGFTAAIGGTNIADQCQLNICGDSATNMGVEQCDAGEAVCLTGARIGKPCCTNADCTVGSLVGTCSGAGGTTNVSGFDNQNIPDQSCTTGNITCRCDCTLPACGDGISDTCDGEGCDDGSLVNGPGHFCNKERLCVGGENPGANCTTDARVCIKGSCGSLQCIQNTCGDGIVAGNEQCDDGNTDITSPWDTCGVSAAVAAAVNAKLHPNCDANPAHQNNKNACVRAACILPFCGDGVTNSGEMCDSGTAQCDRTRTFNPGAVCTKQSDCKIKPGTSVTPPGPTDNICCIGGGTLGCPTGLAGNRDDTPNACRTNCMPPSCGDGVVDAGDQCEPPAAGTFCIKNALGQCRLATCGDGDVCSKTATDTFGTVHVCTSGPNGGTEECDDGNTVDPGMSNTDTCFTTCATAKCGDGIVEVGEQCDSTAMGCSNMREDLSSPELPPDCCLDGNVVDGSKAGTAPGLISVSTAFTALLGCRLPHLISAAACDTRLQNSLIQLQNLILAAQVFLANGDFPRANRSLRLVPSRLTSLNARLVVVTKPGASCAPNAQVLTNYKANVSDLVLQMIAHFGKG